MISVIFPAYNEADNLEVLYHALIEVISTIKKYDFEFIFVDDCSVDQTPEILKQLHKKDKRVKTIRFSRNCGSHAALMAGLENCRGDCAIVLAADLQDPPELISQLMERWESGAKIVWGIRKTREGESPSTKFFSTLYYALMNKLTIVDLPPKGADVFLADRVVIDSFREIRDKHTSVFMTLAWLGFPQSSLEYVKKERLAGISKWTLGKKIKLTLDSLLAFSDVPIRYMSVLGFLTAGMGFVYALYVVWCHINGSPVEGWSSLIVAILVVGGIQMMMLGILGEYLWRTYEESRQRPQYVIEYKID